MVARSQNGYSANDRSLIATYEIVDGIKVPLRKGDTATILLFVGRKFHEKVRKLYVPGCWGYAERPIRGSSTILSNHASGTAEDLIAPTLPLGVDPNKVLTDKEIAEIRHILRYCRTADGHPTVRWGGDYSGRKDAMHFEIIGTPAQCAEVAFKIKHPPTKKNPDGGPTGKFPLPEGHYYGLNDGHARSHSGYYAKDRAAIRRIQTEVGAVPDGDFGDKTYKAVSKWRRLNGNKEDKGWVTEAVWNSMVKK
jgi:hypothetical protein